VDAQNIDVRRHIEVQGTAQLFADNRIETPIFAQQEAPEFEKLDYSATVTVKFELR